LYKLYRMETENILNKIIWIFLIESLDHF
jgi:hypothetical protein